jgi:hypothetical protein
MVDYEIAAPGRVCAKSGRELKPGDRIASVLVPDGGKLVRHDYAREVMVEPPVDAIAFWVHALSDGPAKRPVINDDLLMDLFRHWAESAEPERLRFRYVVALLLMRRKRLKFEDAGRRDGQDVLIVRDAKSGIRHEVPDPKLTDDAIAAVQDEVFDVLGWKV